MKKQIQKPVSWLVVLAMFLSGYVPKSTSDSNLTAAAASTAFTMYGAAVLFSDGFEDDVVGQHPDQWIVESGTTVEVSSALAHLGTKSLHLVDTDSARHTGLKAVFAPTDALEAEFWLYPVAGSPGNGIANGGIAVVVLRQGSTDVFHIGVWDDGDVKYHDSGGWHQLMSGVVSMTVWNKISLRISDMTSADVYLNDTLLGTIPAENTASAVDTLHFSTTGTAWLDSEFYVDDVSINEINLPDFKIIMLYWSPEEPEVMQDTEMNIWIRNIGADYTPISGKFFLDLTLWEAGTERRWFWRFPGQLEAMPTDDWDGYTIERFWFTNDKINRIQACISLEDPEANLDNNCLPRPEHITVHAPASPWRECAMIPVDVAVLAVDVYAGGSASAALEMTKLFGAYVTSITIACQAEDMTCFKTGARFMIDVAITLAVEVIKSLSPHKLIINLVKDAIFLFESSSNCGDRLGKFVRAAIEESRHRKQPINALIVHSPVYLYVVDGKGRRAGFLDNGTPILEIPDSEVVEHNGTKVILYPGTDTASVRLTGTENGTFDLIMSISVPGSEVHTVIYDDVPVVTNTAGEIDASHGQYTLMLDDNGDGEIDRNVNPTEEIWTYIWSVYLPVIIHQ